MSLSLIFIISIGALCASFFSAISGMGGGIIFFALLNLFFDLPTSIALHALVQLMSNGSRVILYFKSVKKELILYYFLASSIGIYLAAHIYLSLPETLLKTVLGVFLLVYTIFFHQIKDIKMISFAKNNWAFVPIGLISGFLSMSIGAVGPLLTPFIKSNVGDKHKFIATKATLQFWVQLVKVILISSMLSFDYGQYSKEVLILCLCVILGTYLGKKVVGKMSDKTFEYILRGALFIASIKILYKPVLSFFE
jgi:uncharacterized membrane protein YfcA